MNDPNDILKKIDDLKKGEMNMNLDIDDDFKELENELKNEKKKEKSKKKDKNESKTNKKAKKNEESDDDNLDDEDLDDELKELEDEGLNDVSDNSNEEVEKPKEEKKNIEKKVEKTVKKKETIEEKKVENEGEDIYQENTENFYHSLKKMTAISVLQKEIETCDKIIKYKIDHKFDDEDIWENKKALVQIKYNNNTTFVQEGSLSIEDYFKEINKELEFNKKLLDYTNKDKKLKSFEIPELKRRLNERIDLLNTEVKQIKEELENQDNDEEEKKEEEKKEEEKKEEKEEEKKEEKVEEKEEEKKEEKEEEKKEEEPKKKPSSNQTKKDIELTKEEQEKYQIIKERLEEYRYAINYCKINDFPQDQLIKGARELNEAKKKIESHNSDDVDIYLIPMPVTPEIVFNYSKEERAHKYQTLIDDLTKQKNEISSEKNNKLEELKKLPKAKFKKDEAKYKKILDNFMKQIEKLNKTIQILKHDVQDKWIPAPLFIIDEKKIRKEKKNEDIEEYYLRIYIGKLTDYKNGKNVSIGLKMIIGDKKEFKENIEASNPECTIFEKSVNWNIGKENFKNLFREKLRVKLRYKSFFRTHIEGLAYIQLKELKNNIDIIEDLHLKEELNQDIPPKIEIKIQIRNPCVGQAFEEVIKNNYIITKQFPSFKDKNALNQNIDSGINNKSNQKIEITKPKQQEKIEIQKPSNNIPQKKPVQKKPQTQENKTENPNQNQPKKDLPHIDKSKFKPNELNDPDIIDNLVSMSVLEYKDKELEEKIKKIEGRTPRPLREKHNGIKVKINFLKNALGDTISPQIYVNIMTNQLAHDKLLYQYFIQENENDKSNIVKVRIQLLLKEIKETEEFIKKGGQ